MTRSGHRLPPPMVVAITGGIASGKSAACICFERMGIFVADADVIARQIVARGGTTLDRVIARFGNCVLTPEGDLDRATLRMIVFADEQARRDLEAILHPIVRQALLHACLSSAGAYCIAAVPLLAESGGRETYPWLDRILVIDAPREKQILRLLARDGGTREQAERILATQATREQRLAIADDVIVNDGSPETLEREVAEMHERYLQLAAHMP